MNDVTKHPSVTELFADAAAQDYFLRLDRIDLSDRVFTPIYMVDSNIIDLHTNPHTRSARSQRNSIGCGEIFRDDPKSSKDALATALGRHIWFELTGDMPLLVPPPLEIEFGTALDVASKWTQTDKKTLEKIGELVAELKAGKGVADRSVARELSSIFVRVHKSRRMTQLSTETRYLEVDHLEAYPDFLPKDVRNCFAPFTDFTDIVAFSAVKSDWIDRLLQLDRKDDVRLDRDAESLARIEIWNSELALLSNPHRIIFITCDASILNASADKVVYMSDVGESTNALSGPVTFLDYCIRHPRGFLARPEVLRPLETEASENENLAESLNGLLGLLLGEFVQPNVALGRWQFGDFILDESVVPLAHKMENEHAELAEKTRAKWSEFIERVELLSVGDQDHLAAIAWSNGADIEVLREYIDASLPEITREAENAWHECIEAFTEFRFLLGAIKQNTRQVRRAPKLCLEGTPAQNFFDIAEDWLREPSSLTSTVFEAERDTLREGDAHDYNFLVVVAYLLSRRQHWGSAAFLCAHATSLSLGPDDAIAMGPNGREAAYLECFCRRHIARTIEDLEPLDSLLTRAEAVYAAELNIVENKMIEAVPERFQCERLAVKYSRLLFQWYEAQADPIDELCLLAEEYQTFLEHLNHEINDINREKRQLHLLLLKQRCLINLVGMGLTFFHSDELFEIASSASPDLLKLLASEDSSETSIFSEIICEMASFAFGNMLTRKTARRSARKLIEEQLNYIRTERTKHRFVAFPYSNMRCQRLLDFLDQGRAQ